MAPEIKPIVIVSRCLGFDHCRYNGQMIAAPFIQRLGEFVEYIPVCPEVEIGLGVPRDPIRIVNEKERTILFQPATGRDVTEAMIGFVHKYIGQIDQVDGFILKNRSPSCGIHDVKIYTGMEKGASIKKGSGFFGGAVTDRFHGLPIEDEGRLTNFSIREHFLIRLFTLSRFRRMKKERSMKALVDFQSRHKYLLLSYNEFRYRQCGRIVANHEKQEIDQVLEMYEQELKLVFQRIPKTASMINTILHLFGGISKYLSADEKRFFLNTVEEYRDERIPLSTLNYLIHAHAIRFNVRFLLEQVFIDPYPKSLLDISDSGKGRDY